jgi:hypothetical protein
MLLKVIFLAAIARESTVNRLNANAAFTIAFTRFIRIGEFTHKEGNLKDYAKFKEENFIQRCITYLEANNYYTLFLLRSKIDYNNIGVRIVIAAANNNAYLL